MTRPSVFYAWQADRPRGSTRDLIRNCATNAIAKIASTGPITDAPRLDHDTLQQSGTPPIAETIFRKIKSSAMFLADVTFTAETRDTRGKVMKRICNDNVMIELGYAAATIGWDRIVLVMNKHYGGPSHLPFDLRNHRFPIVYDLGPESSKDVSDDLTGEIAMAIRECVASDYELVDGTLRKMSSFARSIMRKNGPNQMFWETKSENTLLSRLDQAISQMLAAGVIECVDVANDAGVGYTWTYLGQQCCLKLGATAPTESISLEATPENVFVDTSMYDELVSQPKFLQEREGDPDDARESPS